MAKTGQNKFRKSLQQTVLDAGQSKIGLETCNECGMTYNVDVEKDVKLHKEYHDRFPSTKPFQIRTFQVESWKKHVKYVKLEKPAGAILFVISNDTNYPVIRNKVDEIVKEYVNPELGFCDDVPTWKPKRMILMLIANLEESNKSQPFIAGIAVVDPIEKAQLMPNQVQITSGRFVGINRLWIHQSVRRKGFGTLLTNAARPLLYPDVPMKDTRAAFYLPMGDSLSFVTAYFGNQNGRYLSYEDD